jgi:glycosyltransferase involved in cell wall biosynthesis
MSVIERHIVRRVDKMICVSHAASEYFAKKYKITPPVVITNCTLKRESVNLNQITKSDCFEILNHGQFYEGRGYDIMVESIPLLKEYPEIKLAVRGFGKLEESLKNRAKELGDENFRFYPKVLVEELIPMAAKSKVGVAITEQLKLQDV